MSELEREFEVITDHNLFEIVKMVFRKACEVYSLKYKEKDNTLIFLKRGSRIESYVNFDECRPKTLYLYARDIVRNIDITVTCSHIESNRHKLSISVDFMLEQGCSRFDRIICSFIIGQLENYGIDIVVPIDSSFKRKLVQERIVIGDNIDRTITVKFKKLNPKAIPFSYTRKNDACMDMYALDNGILTPGETRIVYTGIATEIPEGYEGIVRGRSGLASKGILVHLGTVDYEYRGDLGIIMTNLTKKDFYIQSGMRLGQFTVKPVYRCNLVEVEELSETERGSNGYGSTNL